MRFAHARRSLIDLLKFNRPVQAFALIACLVVAGKLMLGGQAPPVPTVRQAAPPSAGSGYLTHISTDKPIYRLGEKVYVRGVVLSADGHFPAAEGAAANFEIKGPKGETVTSGVAAIVDSVAGFSWDIPAGQAGGEYKVRILHPLTGDAPAERKFDIRAYRAPRLKSQIVFVRDGYGPGDTVSASLHVDRAEGGIPVGAKISVMARVDGEEVWKGETAVDGAGNARASFKLPAVIDRGEGSLAMIITDGGTVETATKTIPILLQTLDLSIYPEGGDLVSGLPNRVYLEGRTPAQKPADMAGVVVNRAGREVATFRTEHEGRGRFTFVPLRGETYSLRISEPAGIKTVFPLPTVKDSGVVLASTSDITPRQKDVVVRIGATAEGTYTIALTHHGRELSSRRVTLRANNPAEVVMTLAANVDGVIVATVYDDKGMPMAERLLFRQPEKNLKVRVTADSTDYVPGDKVTLRVSTTDESGKPVGAVVGLTVADSSVLEMIDKREQAPRLPVMVLLENDVKDLADAHVYLDDTNPKAPLATDLLLGTQGWRRFAILDMEKFVAAHGDSARRVLANPVVPDDQWDIAGRDAALVGTVTDRSQAVIPGVTVKVVSADTGVVTNVLTNESGAYNLPRLRAGKYVLNVSLPGFQNRTLSNLELNEGTSYRFNFTLDVASFNLREFRVDARGEAIAFGRAATVGAVLPADRVLDLPLVGNDVLDLIQILPGAQRDAAFGAPVVEAPRQIAKEELQGRAFAQGQAGMAKQALLSPQFIMREYAHSRRPGWTEGSRVDFAETVYWNAGVKTDSSTGIAKVSFHLSDSVTSFRVLADGFANDGALGTGVSHIESVQPFFIEPKIPLQITSGDVIQLPIGIINGTSGELGRIQITAKTPSGLRITMPGDDDVSLGPKERTRQLVQINVGREFSGNADLILDAKAGSYRDSVTRKIDVQPLGFPFERSSGGVLDSNSTQSFSFTLPGEIVRGSLSSSVVVYPTPLASMTKALQALLNEPYGCFEQTSSTSYPMVMAQQYFLTHTGMDPAIVEKARGLLESSYKKLTGFESRTRGYEWFGADPGHEALTAYGLMQFTDMSQVRSVDKDMLDRTRAWLLARRDGKGGFSQSAKAIDTFGRAPVETTNAYITWALIESGEKGLEKEIAAVKSSANTTQDSYVIALAANILYASGDQAGARQLMDRLAKAQDAAGPVKGALTSITRSGGNALDIETTALATLAWMREPAYAGNVEKSLRWIVESSKDGRFGSTQSTILALRSIVAYDAAHARPKAPGRIQLILDGKLIGAPVAFTSDTQGAITLPEFVQELGPGKHTLALRMEDGSPMPYSMSVKYHSTLPDSAEETQIGIQVALRNRQVREGGITEAIVSIANKSDEVLPTPVAIVGIPSGLEVRHDQLKELVKSGRIDAYEVIGREVVLYWRFLKAKDKFDLPLSLIAAIPGSYTGPASRAYLYYTDEYKHWAPGLTVNITPR
jgi:hypothetical protein